MVLVCFLHEVTIEFFWMDRNRSVESGILQSRNGAWQTYALPRHAKQGDIMLAKTH